MRLKQVSIKIYNKQSGAWKVLLLSTFLKTNLYLLSMWNKALMSPAVVLGLKVGTLKLRRFEKEEPEHRDTKKKRNYKVKKRMIREKYSFKSKSFHPLRETHKRE